MVNPPVYHASTILFPTVAAMEAARPHHGVTYGRYGTPTTFALEEAVAALEGGHRCDRGRLRQDRDHLDPAGPAARPATTCWWSIGLRARPAISATGTLTRFGVETTYYDPLIGAGIAELIRPETRIVFTESPGSLTFEMQDIPAIAEAAHAARLPRDHGQHLGLAALLQAVRARRRTSRSRPRPSISAATPT